MSVFMLFLAIEAQYLISFYLLLRYLKKHCKNQDERDMLLIFSIIPVFPLLFLITVYIWDAVSTIFKKNTNDNNQSH